MSVRRRLSVRRGVPGSLRALPRAFFDQPADIVAPSLLGRYLLRDVEGERLILRIVETEAYLGAPDRASHAWGNRRTERTRALFRPGGSAYVYLIYGMYQMLNVVTGPATDGSAVLIRAGEPILGAERMARLRSLRGKARPGDLAGGPGKLCQALAVDRGFDQVSLQRGSLRVTHGEVVTADRVVVGPRVGIDYAGDAAAWPLRFAVAGNPHVSKPHL